MAFVAYLLSAAVGYLAESYLPYSDASPFIALLVSYHLFLTYLIVQAFVKSEQKLGVSMSLPVAFITHLAFLGAMIGVVMGRQYVPLFALLKFVIPGLAPFEVKWVFEGKQHSGPAAEPPRMPAGTHEEYTEFIGYMKQSNRKFQRAGRGLHEEFTLWLKHRHKTSAEESKPVTPQA
jgi:uncharacterized membrane protein required for colicin V production